MSPTFRKKGAPKAKNVSDTQTHTHLFWKILEDGKWDTFD